MHIRLHFQGFWKEGFPVADNTSLTGAALLIDALQANGLNNVYGVVGIPVTDLASLAELKA